MAVILIFGLAVTGCGSKDKDNGEGEPGEYVPFSFDAWVEGVIRPFGNTLPVVTDNNVVAITASNSSGFSISFADIGYTYNSADTLIFTYQIDVTTPMAALTAKDPKDNSKDLENGAGWGVGNGMEYYLGHDTLSIYQGPQVRGTYDAAAKTGTFEVLMKFLPGAEGIGFQHNFWAEYPQGTKVAENSVYTVTIKKIENKAPAE
jgi:hypothetical protein